MKIFSSKAYFFSVTLLWGFIIFTNVFFVFPSQAQTPADKLLPPRIKNAGAKRTPNLAKNFSANFYGAIDDGRTNSTKAIQQAIDACSKSGGGVALFKPGSYLTGALFLKSNVHLRIDEGVALLGSQNDEDYPSLWTRVAGIEMKWPAALINVNEQRNVKISGGGIVDGQGKKWWDKYWNMRRNDYEPRGLRWAVDYDCERVRFSDLEIIRAGSIQYEQNWTMKNVRLQTLNGEAVKLMDCRNVEAPTVSPENKSQSN